MELKILTLNMSEADAERGLRAAHGVFQAAGVPPFEAFRAVGETIAWTDAFIAMEQPPEEAYDLASLWAEADIAARAAIESRPLPLGAWIGSIWMDCTNEEAEQYEAEHEGFMKCADVLRA